MDTSSNHKTRTLWLCGILHACTHVFHVALIPLYLMIRQDFRLASDSQATVLVTIQGLAYFIPSYSIGILADRFNRKALLAIGLALNGLGFVGLAFAPTYGMAIVFLIVAGVGGSFYHPAATAMIARLFPVGAGSAFGRVGIGAGVGFFIGPIYSGWRAEAAGWRAPVFELGLMALVVAGLFLLLAEEQPAIPKQSASRKPASRLFPSSRLLFVFIAACLAFSLRDFAGAGMSSLSSLFLQRARGFDAASTGGTLGALSLMAIISNPLFGGLSDRARGRWISGVLLIAACLMAVMPWLDRIWVIPCLLCYGFFFMANYPMVEAAIMESVPDPVRGRVFGFFITVGGIVSSLAHWSMGEWVKGLGNGADLPQNYRVLFGGLSLLVVASLSGLAMLRTLHRAGRQAIYADDV